MGGQWPVQAGRLDFAIEKGRAFADDGKTYASAQDAVDNASNWVLIGPGDFNETVVVTTPGLYIGGSGRSTRIFQGSGAATFQNEADNVTVQNLSVELTSGASIAFNESGDPNNCWYDRIWLRDSSLIGAQLGNGLATLVTGWVVESTSASGIAGGQNSILYGCYVQGTGSLALRVSNRSIIANCLVDGNAATVGGIGINALNPLVRLIGNHVRENSNNGIQVDGSADDTVVLGNIVEGPSSDGIQVGGSDAIVSANRVHNAGAHGIDVNGTDDIITSNRISGSTNNDLDTAGATTPTTANNVTGAAN